MGVEYSEVPTDEISLRLDNPRFGTDTVANEEEAIGKLAKAPDFLDFAKDISNVGLNPMDIIGVYEENGSYVAGEGNRRFCAIKLLNDPALAPDEIKDAIEELSNKTEFEFDEVYCCIFDDYDKMQDFVSRMHTPGPA